MSDVLAEATDKLKDRGREIEEEIKAIERALIALGDGKPTKPSKPRRGAPRGRKRAKKGEREAQLLEAIQAEPGKRPSEYARGIGVNPSQVHSLLKKLVAEKKIVRNIKDGIQPVPF